MGHVWYILVELKNLSFTFFASVRNYFCFYVYFFGIGRKRLKLELKSAELTDLDSVMDWYGSLNQPPLRFVVDMLTLDVGKKKITCVKLFVTSTILRSKSMHF